MRRYCLNVLMLARNLVLMLALPLLTTPFAMADIVYGAFKGTGLATPNDAFAKSLSKYEKVIVGTINFSFEETSPPKLNKYYFIAKLGVLDYLKGRTSREHVQFLGSGLRGCIPLGTRKAFQARVDALFSDGKEGYSEFGKLVSQLPTKSSDGDCFVAMEIYSEDMYRPYKHRYEVIFQGQTYVVFFKDSNFRSIGSRSIGSDSIDPPNQTSPPLFVVRDQPIRSIESDSIDPLTKRAHPFLLYEINP